LTRRGAISLRITGLRGVGKTVLLKEYDRMARHRDWVVIPGTT
jgi:hypothetical protein